MITYRIWILVSLFISGQSSAQNDTVKYAEKPATVSPWAFVVPSALISYGIARQFTPALRDFERSIDRKVSQNIHRRYTFDNYLQYAPHAGIYLPAMCGVKAKHNMRDRMLVHASSVIIYTSVVQGAKSLAGVTRPGSWDRRSFPSGHTATAFVGAHIMYREYKDTSPQTCFIGYGMAAATGAMRMINRKHWLSDVLAGAGTGIACVELSYLMLPVWHQLFKTHADDRLVISPMIGGDAWGAGIIATF
ncbi:MAG: phosphatase PAP2 family protein [Tannerella sp.]|jgi:membrane-associated phospholipid phosphatase|nr:phosphatase PAP2 family protein [Tannerella sp.]